MREDSEHRSDELDGFTREFVWFDCDSRTNSAEDLVDASGQVAVLSARAGISPEGMTKLMEEVRRNVTRIHADGRLAVVYVAVRQRGNAAAIAGSSMRRRPQERPDEVNQELELAALQANIGPGPHGRQLLEGDCCCPAWCG